jgi:NAD(P)-dependent dehydrogenase (short-subunit alcohol dehydrogenase family)
MRNDTSEDIDMSAKTWLITGAGRGMGVDFAQAALAAGHNVVATGRTTGTVSSAVGGTGSAP